MLNGDVSLKPGVDPISAFIRHQAVERGLLPSSLKTYEAALRSIARLVGSPLEQAAVDQVRDRYVHNPDTVAKAPKTIARERSTLRSFYRWLLDGGAVGPESRGHCTSILAYLGKLKTLRGQRLPQTLTRSEVGRIREVLHQREAASSGPARRRVLRDRAIFELLIGAALRKSELLGLRREDMIERPDPRGDGQVQTWLKIRGKGNKERMVPLMPPAAEALHHYLSDRTSNADRVFELSPYAINLVVSRITAWAAVKPVRVHDLRHTAVTLLIEQGVPISVCQAFVGHASIATTQLYTHLTPEIVRKALEQCRI